MHRGGRVPDAPSTVAEFSAKQGQTPVKGKAKSHAVFKKEDVEVTIQGPPRNDMTNGKKAEDMLITITKDD